MKVLVGIFDALFILLLILGCLTFNSLGAAETPPESLVFESKLGNVTFDHTKHVERVSGDCVACHEKLFPQSRVPLNYKAAMHKKAEAAKTACAGCHVDGGRSFATKGECKTCHVKK